MEPESPRLGGPLAGMKIFLAEDVWHLADAQACALEAAGATVVGIASTLEAAERMAGTLAFDAAVMDLNLHGELTNDLVRRLSALGIRVIVISGYSISPELAAEVQACLAKSASNDDIIKALTMPLRG
jgi:CheY-like chemotaxis protein